MSVISVSPSLDAHEAGFVFLFISNDLERNRIKKVHVGQAALIFDGLENTSDPRLLHFLLNLINSTSFATNSFSAATT